MELLIDTNIILDIVFGRKGYEVSLELFRIIERKGFRAYITASAVTDLYYIIRKETHDTEQAYQILEHIFKLVTVLSVSANDIQDAFQKKWKDFEDCVQITAAENNRLDCVITGNQKDFTKSRLPVWSPQECIDEISKM